MKLLKGESTTEVLRSVEKTISGAVPAIPEPSKSPTVSEPHRPVR